MPRKPKTGLDYFPLDVDFDTDPKIRKLSNTYGSESILVYIEFLCIIYKNGYYVESDLNLLAEDIWYRINIKVGKLELETVKNILNLMVDMRMIDFLMLEREGVITSKAIQKQFYASTIRRKEQARPYWLLTEEDEAGINIYAGKNNINVSKNDNDYNEKINADINTINVDINSINDDINVISADKGTQSKSKRKSKEKKKEDKEDKYDKRNVPFPLSYYTKCLIDDHLITIYDVDLYKFEELFDGAKASYDFELVQRVFRYTRDYVRKHRHEIADIYDYFKKAFEMNLNQMDGYEERLANWPNDFKEMVEKFRMKDDD